MIDKLYESVEKRGNVCVGLDTDLSYIPESFLNKFVSYEDALFNFNKKIIDATCTNAACYKVQIAYYEALGIEGLQAYKKTLKYLKSINCISIADVKRGDITKTAEMYAKAHFEGDFESDFITLTPYMGTDSMGPYLKYVEEKGKGIFILIKTSNEGAKDLQYLTLKNGEKVYEVVGEKFNAISEEYMGKHGYGSIGGVIGCTHKEDGINIRRNLNNMFFLIPGYGAQGGTAENVFSYLRNGNGGVVNSSRGILLAYRKFKDGEENFAEYSKREVIRMKNDIKQAVNCAVCYA